MPIMKGLASMIMLATLVTSCNKHEYVAALPPDNSVIETSSPYQKPVVVNVNSFTGGYYEALPNHYSVTTKKYPLLIFLHGAGQIGDGNKDLPLVLNDGVAKEINAKVFPGNFNVAGNNFPLSFYLRNSTHIPQTMQ